MTMLRTLFLTAAGAAWMEAYNLYVAQQHSSCLILAGTAFVSLMIGSYLSAKEKINAFNEGFMFNSALARSIEPLVEIEEKEEKEDI